MDFDFTEEQRLLRDSVDRLLADRYTFDKRRAYLAEPEGWSRALWSQYAELGLLGLPFAEEHGGFGGGGIEVMLLMEAFGRSLVLEPFLATVVLAGTALRLAGSEAQQAALLPEVAEGKLLLAIAHGESQARYELSDVLTTAKPKAGGWVLDGAKSVVAHGDSADRLGGGGGAPAARPRAAPLLHDARRDARCRDLVERRGARRGCGARRGRRGLSHHRARRRGRHR